MAGSRLERKRARGFALALSVLALPAAPGLAAPAVVGQALALGAEAPMLVDAPPFPLPPVPVPLPVPLPPLPQPPRLPAPPSLPAPVPVPPLPPLPLGTLYGGGVASASIIVRCSGYVAVSPTSLSLAGSNTPTCSGGLSVWGGMCLGRCTPAVGPVVLAYQALTLAAVNQSSGALAPVPDAPRPPASLWAVAAADPAGHRYFVVDQQARLLAIDTQSGSNSTSGSMASAPASLEYDPATGKLFAVAPVGGALALVEVNATSGALNTVASLPEVRSVYWGVSALDPALGHYYFVGSDAQGAWRLYRVDTKTGALGASTGLDHATLKALEFDAAAGTLYGLAGINQSFSVVLVEPATGSMVVKAQTNATSVWWGVSSFDPLTHRFFFEGSSGCCTLARRLFAVDAATGAAAESGSLPQSLASLGFVVA